MKTFMKYKDLIWHHNFKTLIFVFIILHVYLIKYSGMQYSYIGTVLAGFTNEFYLFIVLGLYLINTLSTISLFDQNYALIIRCGNKKGYFHRVLLYVLLSNSVLFLLQLAVFIIEIVLLNQEGLVIDSIGNYDVTNVVYVLFYIIRYFILIQLFSVFGALLSKLFSKFVILSIQCLGVVICLVTSTTSSDYVVDSLSKMFVNPVQYFWLNSYKTFTFEILCSGIYIVCILLILYLF